MEVEHRVCKDCVQYEDCKQNGPSLRACQRVIEQLYYSDIRDKDVLEIGCGTKAKGGFIKAIVEQNGCRWTGIDIVETDLATHVCSVDDMPFEDGSFDYVIGSQTLEHWKKPKKALREVRRVLRDDGVISLTAPIHLHGEKMFVRGEFEAIEKLFTENGFNIDKFETWQKWHSELVQSPLNEYARKKLKKAGIVDYDGIIQYVIHCVLTKNDKSDERGFWQMLFGRKTKISKIADLLGCEAGKPALIIGVGGTIKEHEDAIRRFIDKAKPVTFGINNMTGFCVPDYHLWTNKQRYRDLGQNISPRSKMIFGCGLGKELIRKHHKGDYIQVDYSHSLRKADLEKQVDYKDGRIYGNFRTAGCLAIMIAHLFGVSDVYVVGMDGFTLHKPEELAAGGKSQHFYGKGFTDDASWEECVEKDRLVYENLRAIEAFGITPKIITPTKFEQYFEKGL